ncbi:MAG TPA: hypothetical protein VFM80_12815 [Gracilimonas sp.]|uniref:hypothetical protein n=1 Tax=Gracilimonas sp. TaxID=1974203 RepID=UPI002DA30BC0|nr:hypothetical protein [Gracilimonas sp.]
MNLKENFISKNLFQKIIIGLMLIFAGLSIKGGFFAFQQIQTMLDKDILPTRTEGMESYRSHFMADFRSFKFTQTANIDTIFTFVTLTDLSFAPSSKESWEILNSATGSEMLLGLSSHPSFLVSEEQRSFWISQIYLELGFIFGGIILVIFVMIWITLINFEQYKKLFTTEIYRWVLGLYFILFAGFIIDALLYARKINFINAEFGLGLSPTDGISPTMMFVLLLLLFLIIFIRKGIPMQNEQDLTV